MIDIMRVRKSLPRAADQLATLLRSTPDTNVRMPKSDWTIGEAAAHVIMSMRTYGGWATGKGKPEELGILRRPINVATAEINAQRIAAIDTRDGASLATMVSEDTRAFVDDSADIPADAPYEWYDGVTIDFGSISAIMLAELLVHGYDIAKTASKPWPIDPGDAETMVLGALALLPYYVNKETAAGASASWEIRVRGGSRVGIRLEDGAGRVEIPPRGRYDCIVSADPNALLLVSYGRTGVVGPALRGKMVAFGRKPWLGLKFGSYFLNP